MTLPNYHKLNYYQKKKNHPKKLGEKATQFDLQRKLNKN